MRHSKFVLPLILLAGAAIWASCDGSNPYQQTGGETAQFTVAETGNGGITVTDNGPTGGSVNPLGSSSSGSSSSGSSSSSGGTTSSSSSSSGGDDSSSSSSSGSSSSGSSSSGSSSSSSGGDTSSSSGSSSGSSSSGSSSSSGGPDCPEAQDCPTPPPTVCAKMEVTTPSPDITSSCPANKNCSVDTASIGLNDDEIFSQKDFNNHPFTKSRPVELNIGLNTLHVWIKGKPENTLLVKIFDCAEESPQLLYRRTFIGHLDTTDTFSR